MSALQLVGTVQGNTIQASVNPELFSLGYTNYSEGMNGTSNIKNRKLHFSGCGKGDANVGYTGGQCTMTLGSGSVRTYSWSPKSNCWWLSQENKPNGHKLLFTYNEGGLDLRTTNASQNVVFNAVQMRDVQGGYRITGSNGQSTFYGISNVLCKAGKKKKKKGFWTFDLTQITPSHGPKLSLEYHYKRDREDGLWRKLSHIGKPDGRYLKIDYHRDQGKVMALRAPLGRDGKEGTLASFHYHNEVTIVCDALQHQTAYRLSPHKRVTAIERYSGVGAQNSLYSSQQFVWGDSGLNMGHLMARGLRTSNNTYVNYTTGIYDSRGNIIKEELFGNLTGMGSDTFILGPDQRPIAIFTANEKKQDDLPSQPSSAPRPVECHVTHFSYSTDGFNLLLEERHPDGRSISYRYKPGTDLLIAKLTKFGDRILSREFHEYDGNGILVQTFLDDGSGQAIDNYTDVTGRKVICYTPFEESPWIGFPRQIAEHYYNPTTQTEYHIGSVLNTYNEQGQLTAQEHYDADEVYRYTLLWKYDEKGNLVSQTDALGQHCLMEYDDNKNKIREELIGSGFRTFYRYDLMNRLIKSIEKHEHGACFLTEYRYDLVGNKIAQIESHNETGSEETDGFSNQTNFVYDEFGREIEVHYPACATLRHGYQPSHIKKEYNILDQVTAVIDQNGHRTTTTYNLRGQPVCITYSDETQERYEYNLNGTVAKKWEKEGLCHHYSYDGRSRLVRTDTYDESNHLHYSLHQEYHGDHLIRETDAMGYVTEYTYDERGRKNGVLKQTDTGFERTSFTYNALGGLRETKRWYGTAEHEFITTIEERDLLDRLVEVRTEDAGGNLLRKESYAYDRLGNRTKTQTYDSLETSSTTQTLYNSKGLPIEEIDALGHSTHISYNYRYINPVSNKQVLQKITTDPLGNQTLETHDALQRLVCIEKLNAQGRTIAIEELCYDLTGDKVRQRNKVLIGGAHSHDYVVQWEYDCMHRPTLIEEKGQGLQKITRQTYDSYGRLQTLTKPDGVTLHHAYDSLGRLETLSSSDGTISYHYCYDLHNNPILTTDHVTASRTVRSYDAWSRLITEELATGLCFQYSYDSLGRLLCVVLPDASSIAYTYDAIHLKRVQRLNQVAQPTYQHEYLAYDLAGHELSSRLIGQAGLQQRSWDPLGRNTRIETAFWAETILEDGYDVAGNLRCMLVKDIAGDVFSHYSYNDLYQLIAEESLTEHTYAYDSLHNRLRKDDAPYAVNGLNQIVSDSESVYHHDANGNRISKCVNDQETHYVYDALNRLTSVQTSSWKVSYFYDSFGRRLSCTHHIGQNDWEPLKRICYLYQGQKEIGANRNGHLEQLRVLGTGKGAELGAAVAVEILGHVYAPIHDHRGNVCCLVESQSGQLAEAYRYTAYGEHTLFGPNAQTIPSSLVENPWLFASKRLDPLTGLIQFGKRDYDSNLGRWLTPDPAGFADGPNLYAYVHNDPMTLFDPWGLAINWMGPSGLGYDYFGSSNAFSSRLGQGFNSWNSRSFEPYSLINRPLGQPNLGFASQTNGGLQSFVGIAPMALRTSLDCTQPKKPF